MMAFRSSPIWKTCCATFVVAAVLFAGFFGTVVRHFASGIAYSAQSAQPPMELVQGDHLQLLYHFDLAHSFIQGETPWFRNLYEFNTSDEDCPRRIDPFYAPFSIPYATLRSVGASKAAAWNLCQFLSVFLGVLFSLLLARRFRAGPWCALAIALLANCVPYRWVVLAGGSPTGFGMGLIPGIALGVDLAVRDGRVRGGVLAAVLCAAAYAADLHCFLFAILALPLWGVLSLLAAPVNPLATRRGIGRTALALSPFLPAGAVCAAFAAIAKSGYASTDVAGGRTLKEIQRCSPDWHSFFDPSFFCHMPGQFHMGYGLSAAMLAAGLLILVALVLRLRRGPNGTAGRIGPLLAGLLLGAALVFLFLLALGTNGPFEYAPLRIVRKLVPPFRMVRQPIKCLCLVPTLLTAFFAVAASILPSLVQRIRSARLCHAGLAVAVVFVLAVFVRLAGSLHPGICLLTGPNAAYEAVVTDAESRGLQPRALVLPIWPGDSAYSSVYQYDAMYSRLRMLNGYAATQSPAYIDDVFLRFSPMTTGSLGAEQFEGLKAYGVTAVLLHENEWPAKVSPYPFGHTLHTLLASSDFRYLGHDHGVWAFAYESKERGSIHASSVGPVYKAAETPRFPAVEALSRVPANPDGTATIPVAYLSHEFGETELGPDGFPCGLRFRPRKDPPCLGCNGPFLPFDLKPGRYRLTAEYETGDSAGNRIGISLPGQQMVAEELSDGVSFEYDGGSDLAFEFHYGGTAPILLRSFRMTPVPNGSATRNP